MTAPPSISYGAQLPSRALPFRIGHGFDLHRLEEGPYKLILGGLEIPHDRGCVAHSDG
jgi:2-C-methyl-D-erythritol 2,4-cyclodiphosphate synthase